MKKIVILCNILNEYGGVHTYAKALAKMFNNKLDYQCYFVGLKHSRENSDYIFSCDDFTEVYSIEKNRIEAQKLISRKDIIIISLQFKVHLNLQSYFKTKQSVLMFVGDAKDIGTSPTYSWHINKLKDNSIYNYSALVALLPSNEKILKEKVGPNLAMFVKNVSISIDQEIRDNYSENRNYAYVGRLDRDKNIFDLIKIAKLCNKDVKIHIYGDGELKNELLDEIKKENLQNILIYEGFKAPSEIYKNKNGLISTSLSEGLGLVFIEAYYNLLPIFCYDSFTTSKDIVFVGNGKIIESNNQHEFANVLSCPPLRDKQKIKEKLIMFDEAVILEKWEEIFEINNFKKPKINRKIKDFIKNIL